MDGSPPPSDDGAKDQPLDARVVHKNWKIRKEAYEELGRKFEGELDGSASIFSEFGASLTLTLSHVLSYARWFVLEF